MRAIRRESVRIEEEQTNLAVVAEINQWVVFVELNRDNKQQLHIQEDDTIVDSLVLKEPRDVDIAADGTTVIADWVEYGAQTEAEIHVLNPSDGSHHITTVELSSPLVANSHCGDYLAVTGYNQVVRIYRSDPISLIGTHTALFGGRLVPQFERANDLITLASGQPDEANLRYQIDKAGSVVNKVDDIEKIQYANSFELDKDSDWKSDISELTKLYQTTTDEAAKNIIANIVGDASLSYLTDESTIETIITNVVTAHDIFKNDHQKLSAKILSDAYYRLGKVRHKQGYYSDAHKQWKTAKEYATVVLPWYDGKDMLAKVHRKQARAYKRQNEYKEARSHIEQIFELEDEYNVQLASDSDERLYDSLS
ncbi:hypothetical protein [Haloquadratum walsbyi]|jgi:hypothetical protein|uniref:Uncharacterized protein n=1 Tax=Haloquadratum walsbyi (strain DSM 16790 / HBSQ001) TaxID=362976 RepID=Q18IG3_HALWD|nr:hypothetical protein [Haloquadratum walsbyi]CAJ52209.1 uncharacterized protein HQ_2082A [Haloquadratum walsbyi DSM 16790]